MKLHTTLLAGLIAGMASNTAMAQSDTLAKIKAAGTVHIGARDSQITFSYKPMG